MASPSVCLEWRDLNVVIEKSSINYFKCQRIEEKINILNHANGYLESGNLVAILGSSGAGKTTLLAAVSQRLRGTFSGEILLNGRKISRKEVTEVSCFVPQFDITINSLTAYEHLYYIAELKLNPDWSRARKDARIHQSLRKLGLLDAADTKISSLSGGQRRKLNLATDLITDPPIIFCDEPTTGLDTFNAISVVESLKQLSNSDQTLFDPLDCIGTEKSYQKHHLIKFDELETANGNNNKVIGRKAIMCSIHQPTSDIFRCFSHIILMHAGRCVFQGSVDETATFFSSLGFQCPIAYNPAEYYVGVISRGPERMNENHGKLLQSPIEIIQSNYKYEPRELSSKEFFPIEWRAKSASWFKQVFILMQRNSTAARRNIRETTIKLLVFLIPFIAMSVVYRNTTGRDQESAQNVRGIITIMTSEVILGVAFTVILVYPLMLPLIRRETGERIYELSAFYVAKLICQVPEAFIICLFAVGMPYFFTGLSKGFWLFCKMLGVLGVTAVTANAYGFCISAIFDSTQLTAEISPPFDTLFLVFSGIFINLKQFQFLKYISAFFFANEALAILYWNDVTSIACPRNYRGHCFRNGTEILETYSYNTSVSDIWQDFIGLFTLTAIFHILAYLGIRRLVRNAGYY